jgi:orotate phosphoribosyltransferase-like protein
MQKPKLREVVKRNNCETMSIQFYSSLLPNKVTVYYILDLTNEKNNFKTSLTHLHKKAKLGDTKSISIIAKIFSHILIKQKLINKSTIITPVAAHQKNSFPKMLSEEISKNTGAQFKTLLTQKYWPSKKIYLKLNKKEKENIIKDTVYCRKKNLKENEIVLIDDCTTTGTVLKTSSEILLKNKAKKVTCIVNIRFANSKQELTKCKLTQTKEDTKFAQKILINSKKMLVSAFIFGFLKLPNKTIEKMLKKCNKKNVLNSIRTFKKTRKITPLQKNKIQFIEYNLQANKIKKT